MGEDGRSGRGLGGEGGGGGRGLFMFFFLFLFLDFCVALEELGKKSGSPGSESLSGKEGRACAGRNVGWWGRGGISSDGTHG